MYRKLLRRWQSELPSEEFETLKTFSRLMDRNSLWLGYVEEGDPIHAYYTDDACWYQFTVEEMEEIQRIRSDGESIDWEKWLEQSRLEETPDFEGINSD